MASPTSSLVGKTAIVTGAGKLSGIGAATALEFARLGANVVIQYNKSAAEAQRVVEKINSLGGSGLAVRADATGVSFGEDIVQASLSHFPTIDIIVNNAGTAVIHPSIAEVDSASWDEIYHVNVRAPFLLIQAASPHLREGARIVNVTSVIAKMGSKMLTVYASSKAALTSMTVCLAEELGERKITINAVAPGPIATDLSMKGSPIFEKLQNNAHIKREGSAEEVASAIVWLSSPGASYITGQLIPVDGGIDWP